MTARAPRRFVVREDAGEDDVVHLSPGDAHHARRVLRLASGDAVEVTTARGTFQGTVDARPGGRVAVRLGPRAGGAPVGEACGGVAFTLALGLAHPAAMDDAVRAAVEMGARALVPLRSARGEHPPGAALARREDRWRRVMAEAVKQCRRPDVPELLPAAGVADLAGRPEAWRVLLAPRGAGAAGLVPAVPGAACLLAIGPEGGFDAAEEGAFAAMGFAPLSLGPHVLRVPTAVVAALAVLRAAARGPREAW